MSASDATAPATALQELRAGWRPLLACAVGIGLGLSPLPPFTAGIFATELQHAFGWSRGAILASIIFVTVALALFGPVIGRIVDRHGARRVALPATLGLGLSLIALGFITAHIWTFYLCWAALALFGIGTLPITYVRVINGWFDRGRGLALGIALASTGITGALVPILIHAIIDRYGWRAAYAGLGALPILIALPILWIFLEEPRRTTPTRHVPLGEGQDVGQAIRHYRFWALSFAGLCMGSATGGLIPNLVPLLTDNGLTMQRAIEALAILSGCVIVGRLITGALLDRLWGPLVGVLLLTPALGALALLSERSEATSSAFLAVAGIGLIAGAEFDLVAYMTGRYFGRRHFSAIYGIQYAVFGIGSGCGPAAYGALHDLFGSYRSIPAISGTLFLLAGAALLTLGRYPRGFADLPSSR